MKQIEREIIARAAQHVTDLLTAHWPEIKVLIDEAPDSQVSIGGAFKINWQEAAPKLKTSINFSKKVTDECEDELNDPRQIRIPGTDPEDLRPEGATAGEEEPPHVHSGAGEGEDGQAGTETQKPQADAPRGRGRRKKATAE